MGGCKALHKCGIAASHPMAPERHPRAVTANPTANGNCVRVRFSIGTLNDASIVAYLSESNKSRLRSVFIESRARSFDAPAIVREVCTDSQVGGDEGEHAESPAWRCIPWTNSFHEPTHPQPLPGGEQASVRLLSVPLLGGARGGFMVPMHARKRKEALHEPRAKAGAPVLRSSATAEGGSSTHSKRCRAVAERLGLREAF